VITLLNRVPVSEGGAGGSLTGRVVSGLSSDALYRAILQFEDKHFPRQRSGFVEPGGPMLTRLEQLGTRSAPVPASPPPAAAPAPPTTSNAPVQSIPRLLTPGERHLLSQIFGDTLDYDRQIVARNDSHTGGVDNSFTPGYVPNMSPRIWSWDYSTAPAADAAVFVHEMVHVWQSGHGRHNILRGLYLWKHYDAYEDSYKYNLDSSPSLDYFNMEQSAAIIEDSYRVSNGLPPDNNVGSRKSSSDYAPYVAQLKGAGKFEPPLRMRDGDYIGHNF
jgi:hypothetical protein